YHLYKARLPYPWFSHLPYTTFFRSETFVEGPRTFLLLHGIGMGRSVYLDVVQRLRGRVIALDLPGFGEAPEPARTFTMERHADRSEEHTSELQSRFDIVCRLLLEKK